MPSAETALGEQHPRPSDHKSGCGRLSSENLPMVEHLNPAIGVIVRARGQSLVRQARWAVSVALGLGGVFDHHPGEMPVTMPGDHAEGKDKDTGDQAHRVQIKEGEFAHHKEQ